MANAAWVCFDCRFAVRRPTSHTGDVVCPECGAGCRYLGYRIRVPGKRAVRAWAALRESLAAQDRARQTADHVRSVRARHDLEKEIRRLEALPSNPGRRHAIALLRKQLRGE